MLDLSVDALPHSDPWSGSTPSPCTPTFRSMFRDRMAEAVRLAAEGDAHRPVLLTTGHPSVLAAQGRDVRRCFNALLVEAAASYRTVRALPVGTDPADLPTAVTRALAGP